MLGRLIGAVTVVCGGALVAQFVTQKLANFKPPYGTTVLACFFGYLANLAVAFVIGTTTAMNNGQVTGTVNLLTLVVGYFAQATFHSFMLKDTEGVPLGYSRACVVSLVQYMFVAGLFVLAVVVMASAAAANR